MKKFTTVELLAMAAAVMLAATTVSYALPHVPDALRTLLGGQFLGYSGALLVALKTDDPQNPSSPSTPA